MTSKAWSGRPAGKARLLIADDHELARAGLRSLLAGERGIEVIGEATDGREALSLCLRLRPDLVLMDVRMPDVDGLAATRAIKQRCPGTSVIMVTMHESPDYLLEAVKAGAAGYLLKDATKSEIVSAVRQVLGGESLLQPELMPELVRRLASEGQGTGSPPQEWLTPRQTEVLVLLARGLTNREIAQSLVVSVSTAKAHVEHIIARLGASDRTQAVVRAIELGFLNPSRLGEPPVAK